MADSVAELLRRNGTKATLGVILRGPRAPKSRLYAGLDLVSGAWITMMSHARIRTGTKTRAGVVFRSKSKVDAGVRCRMLELGT